MRFTRFLLLAGIVGFALPLTSLGQAQTPKQQLSEIPTNVLNVIDRSADVGPKNPSTILHVSVSLPYQDDGAIQAFANSVSDPKSPNYRHFITPEEVGQRFGLPSGSVQKVADYLTQNGFKINLIAKNHLSILADCTVKQAEQAFSTTIREYRALLNNEPGNPNFFAFSKRLSIPMSIAPFVSNITGLESFTKPQLRSTLTPTQTRVLYNLSPMYNGGSQGQGRTIAISNFDGYRLSNVPLYYSQYGLPTPSGGAGSNITVVTVSGGAGSGTPGAEGDLDIQMVLGMAPLCNFRIYDGGGSDLIGVLTAEVNDNASDVISESYGWNISASTATAAHNLHLSMTAQGITYMAASGDSGTTLEPYSYPDYDPEVLMVGGSSASVNTSGTRISEVGWNSGGGGWSTNTASFNVLPSWQHGTGVPTTINHRLVPDVALHASGTQTSSGGAYSFYFNGSIQSGYIGTSFASPVYAGSLGVSEQSIIAQGGLPANGAGKRRFGRIQDLFYSQNMRSDVWLDITSGQNGKLPNGATSVAGAGWDYVTGLGVINFNTFVTTQVSTSPDFSITASPASQSVVQGSGTSYTTTTTALNGFAGSVGLTVAGLPTGATGSFSPTSITGGGSSALSVTTATSTPTGTYTLTVTGTSGTLTHSTTVTLVVNSVTPPGFTISASPSSRTVTRPSSATYTISIGSVNGFSGAVTLSATGQPNGVTFSPATVTGSGTSTMTLTSKRRNSAGTYTITVKGTSGSTSHTTTVTLVLH